MSKTFRFRNDNEFRRKAHFRATEYDYSDKQRRKCDSKVAFISERMAQYKAIEIMTSIDLKTGMPYNGKYLNVYRCSVCKNWHLTSQTPRRH